MFRGWWFKNVKVLIITNKSIYIVCGTKFESKINIRKVTALTFSSSDPKDFIIHIRGEVDICLRNKYKDQIFLAIKNNLNKKLKDKLKIYKI